MTPSGIPTYLLDGRVPGMERFVARLYALTPKPVVWIASPSPSFSARLREGYRSIQLSDGVKLATALSHIMALEKKVDHTNPLISAQCVVEISLPDGLAGDLLGRLQHGLLTKELPPAGALLPVIPLNGLLDGSLYCEREGRLSPLILDAPLSMRVAGVRILQVSSDGTLLNSESLPWSLPEPSILPTKFDLPKLLALDFDGVLTDNRVLVGKDGSESVTCSRADGQGVWLFKQAGVQILIISSEENEIVRARGAKLQIPVLAGCKNKLTELSRYCEQHGLPAASVMYVGNDVNDIGCLRWCGMPIAVADSVTEVLEAAQMVLTTKGGYGIVRELATYFQLTE